jgi:hypothetical protein
MLLRSRRDYQIANIYIQGKEESDYVKACELILGL